MSLIRIDVPDTDIEAEVEYTGFIVRFFSKATKQWLKTFHVSGGQIGKACLKDFHGPVFNRDIQKAADYVLAKHNFNIRGKDRQNEDGSFHHTKHKIKAIKPQ